MKNAIQNFKKFGYGVIPNFISQATCKSAIQQINRLIMSYQPKPQQLAIFTSETSKAKKTDDYFLQSADKVSYFFEEGAYKDGKLAVEKLNSINKIGHALHEHNKLFQMITFQKQIAQICNNCNIISPLVVQSMAILKPPKIGGKVKIHQDSTFLYDEPLSLVGFWIPLQDATLNNGCLWGLPGSHNRPLYSRAKLDWQQKQMKFQKLHEIDYQEKDFVPLEMKRGSLAFFHGKFLHKSQVNSSEQSRYAYTWHLKNQNSKWSSQNWLQRKQFPKFKFNYDRL